MSLTPNHVESILDALVARVAEAVAERVAERVAKHAQGDDLVDRRTAPIAKRQWDRFAGRPGGFAAYRDGRRIVARRGDVMSWLASVRGVDRPAPAARPAAPRDPDAARAEAAGLRLPARRRP